MSKYGKRLSTSNKTFEINLLSPFIVYTLINYWNLPMWMFATWMTLWVINFVACVWLNYVREEVKL